MGYLVQLISGDIQLVIRIEVSDETGLEIILVVCQMIIQLSVQLEQLLGAGS